VERNLPWVLIGISAAERQTPGCQGLKAVLRMCFVQTVKGLRLIARPRGRKDSINAGREGKINFVIRFRVDKKTTPSLFSNRELSDWQKSITSKLRQGVKPGRSTLILQGKLTASHAINI
jgi:hypothetical protein